MYASSLFFFLRAIRHSKWCASLFIIAKTWRQPKCPIIDKWIKIWYIHAMEYYSAVKKK